MPVHLGSAMHESDFGAMPPKIQRRNGGRILAADHQDFKTEIRVRLVVVVMHLAEFLAGNAQIVRQVVVPGADNQFFGTEDL